MPNTAALKSETLYLRVAGKWITFGGWKGADWTARETRGRKEGRRKGSVKLIFTYRILHSHVSVATRDNIVVKSEDISSTRWHPYRCTVKAETSNLNATTYKIIGAEIRQ